MVPLTAAASPARLDLFSTDEESSLALWRIMQGRPLPENVVTDIDPYQHLPSNLPGEVWFYFKCNGNIDSSPGCWKPKGKDVRLFSNSSYTGWRTTFEFYERQGQAPDEHKTGWVMVKYWMSWMGFRGNGEQKETNSLCKVFLGDEQFQNHEKIQKTDFSIIPNAEPVNPNHQLVIRDASNYMANGSTRMSEIIEDDKRLELAVAGKPLEQHLEEILSEMDHPSDDDFIELLDFENPASSSSSSDNSSCLSMSSDELFDSAALLEDMERDINHNTVQRDAACKFSAPAPFRLKLVDEGASDYLVSIKRSSHTTGEGNLPTDSTVPGSSASSSNGCKELKQQPPRQSEKAGNMEGPSSSSSSSSESKTGSNGEDTGIMDGGQKKKKKKKSAGGRKKIHKKYLCFFPF